MTSPPRGQPAADIPNIQPNRRTVLITGASSGIGRATAAEFRAHGWTVYGTARAPQAIAPDERIDGVSYLELDYRDPATIAGICDAVPRIDALINNAGIGQAGALEDQPPGADRELFGINVFGPLELTRACLPAMRAQHGGTVIFVGSLIAEFPVPFQSGYAASKLALNGYVQSLRHELRPYGIRVTVVEPGYVRTGIADKRPWIAPPYYRASITVKRRVEREHRRAGDPAALARHLRRLTERSGSLPPRATVGIQPRALTIAKRFVPDMGLERFMARRFGLSGNTPG